MKKQLFSNWFGTLVKNRLQNNRAIVGLIVILPIITGTAFLLLGRLTAGTLAVMTLTLIGVALYTYYTYLLYLDAISPLPVLSISPELGQDSALTTFVEVRNLRPHTAYLSVYVEVQVDDGPRSPLRDSDGQINPHYYGAEWTIQSGDTIKGTRFELAHTLTYLQLSLDQIHATGQTLRLIVTTEFRGSRTRKTGRCERWWHLRNHQWVYDVSPPEVYTRRRHELVK